MWHLSRSVYRQLPFSWNRKQPSSHIVSHLNRLYEKIQYTFNSRKSLAILKELSHSGSTAIGPYICFIMGRGSSFLRIHREWVLYFYGACLCTGHVFDNLFTLLQWWSLLVSKQGVGSIDGHYTHPCIELVTLKGEQQGAIKMAGIPRARPGHDLTYTLNCSWKYPRYSLQLNVPSNKGTQTQTPCICLQKPLYNV